MIDFFVDVLMPIILLFLVVALVVAAIAGGILWLGDATACDPGSVKVSTSDFSGCVPADKVEGLVK